MSLSTDGIIILIVDDQPDNPSDMFDLLEGGGYCVVTVKDSDEGLQRARQTFPDLILLGAPLSDDGFVLCSKLKADATTRHIPVLFIIAEQVDTKGRAKIFAAGGADYLTTPLHADEVLARIGTQIRLYAAERRLVALNAQQARREANLSERDWQFRTLAENLPDNIVRYDLDCRAVYLNLQLAVTLGVAVKEMLGKTPQEVFSGGEFADYQARIAEVIKTRQDQEISLVLPDTGTGIRHHHVRFIAESGADGEIVGVLGVGRDISESKQAERQLQILNRAVDAAMEAAFLMDGRGRFVYVNAAACRSLGYSRDQLLTMSPFDIDPDISREAFEGLLQAMFTGNYSGGPVESRHRARDGRIFPVEMSASVIEYDKAQFCLVMARDISERKAVEIKLHASEQMFRAVVENSPDAIVRYDPECRRIFVNRATQTMYGTPVEQLIGKTPAEYSALGDGLGFTNSIRQVFDSGEECQLEVVCSAQGKTGWGHARLVPEFGADGRVVNVLAIVRDITVLKNSELSFRTLAENAPDNIARYDRHCRLYYQNPRLEALWGDLAPAFIGKTPQESFPDGVFADYQARVAAVIETGQENEIEITLPDAGDGERYHQIRFVAERGLDGEIVGALAIGRDITERYNIQRELEIHNIALNTSNDAVLLQNNSLRFVFVNNTACRSLGYSREELLTMGPFDINPDLTPEKVQMKMESIAKNGGVFKFETCHRAKDGRIFPVEISSSQFEYEGDVFGLSIVRDITERKRLEDALRFVAQRGWEADGMSFFEALAQYLGQILGVDYVVVDKLGEVPDSAETLALYAKGGIVPNMSYSLAGTPCDNVMGRDCCCYPRGIQQLFPEDNLLVDMGAESYAGTPLWDSAGQPLGLIAVLDGKPLEDESGVIQMLKLVAPRAAAELERARSDALLLEREREFRSLAESSPDCIIRYDLDGRILYLNTALVRQMGIASAIEVVGKLPREAWPDGRYDAIDGVIARAVATQAVTTIEIVAPTPEGEMHSYEIRAVPEWGDAGAMIGTIAFGRDITDLKRYEQSLRVSEQQFRSLAENAPDNIARYDRQARHLYVNPQLAETMGLAPSDMLGKTPAETSPGSKDAPILKVLETGEPVEIEVTLPDTGAGVRYHNLRFVPEYGENSEIIGVLGIGRDITEMKRAERDLLILSSAINKASDSIFLIDQRQRFTYVNDQACRSLDYGRDELLTMGIADIDAHFSRQALVGRQGSLLVDGPQLGRLETQHRTAGGRTFPVELSAAVVEHESEKMALVVARDISERKQAEFERQTHLHFLESLGRVDRTIQGTNDLDAMMGDVLDVVLDVFGCDRAFLMYPCDPGAARLVVPMERTKPEFPGVLALGEGIPMDDEVAAKLNALLHADGPVKFGSGSEHPLPAGVAARFGFKSLMSMAVYPQMDKPWEFGIQQCAHRRTWSADEETLFREIGRRLTDRLTSLLAHRRVLENEAHLRTLVRTIPDLIWLKDPNGIFLRCNQQFERFLGVKEADIVGKTDYDVRDRASAEFYRENDRQILACGKSRITEEWLTFATDGYRGVFEVIRTPLRDVAGKTLGILGVAHDITRRKSMEDALRVSEQEFRSLAENLPDIVMRYDLDCRRIYANPAYVREVEGLAELELNAMRDARQWCSSNVTLKEYKARLRQVMSSGEPAELLVQWMRGDNGEALCYAVHIVAERDADGRVAGVLCIGRNIAKLMESERRLEESRQQLRDLAVRREDAREEERRHIARELHDGLGQQLTALRFSVTLLDYEFGEAQPRIREVVGNLLQQVNRTIQSAREASSALRPAVLDMGIMPALEWLVAEHAPYGGVSIELKGKSGNVRMNEAHTLVVFRIVQESLTNAVRHSKADRIQVIFSHEADAYVVEVQDNGVGFDPGAPRDHRSVGLVGIRERVHAVGGELVLSSSPGWGTVLRVRIPAEEKQKEES